MSVWNKSDKEQDGGAQMYRGGETCFHCHHAVWNEHAIHWHGSDDQNEVVNLIFHPGCAVEFSIRLLGDVHQVERKERLGVYLKSECAR